MEIERRNLSPDVPKYETILIDKAKLQQLRKQWEEAGKILSFL